MQENTLLSVVMPVYNAEQYLERCVESVLAQTYHPLELLLVDDGSLDGSPAICDAFCRSDSRVRVFHKQNGGPSAARNLGIQNATGRFISFIDADDYLEPGMYSSLINEMQAQDVAMAVCRWIVYDLETKRERIADIGAPGLVQATQAARIIMLNDEEMGGGFPWNRVIDVQKIRESRSEDVLFPEGIHAYEDKCYVLECLSCMDQILITDTVGYHYQVHAGSLTQRAVDDKLLDIAKAWEYNYALLERMQATTDLIETTYRNNMTNYLIRLQPAYRKEGKAIWNSFRTRPMRERGSIKYWMKYLALSLRYR